MQVAVNLAKIVDADICEIIPLQPYTSADLDWHNSHSRSSVEMNNSESRPDIKPIELDLKNYDCIFLGYPIWWDLAPRVVNTFIESNDLTGKTVIQFATSGGSSIEGSIEALKKSYPDIKWRGGKLLNGESEKALKTCYLRFTIYEVRFTISSLNRNGVQRYCFFLRYASY